MQVRRYELSDFAQVSEWALDGYNTDYTEEQFPKTGFIVDGIAAYFLYSTDSSVCFLENMISNKKADPMERHLALNLIVEAILKEAASLGFKVAYGTTDIPAVIYRATTWGAIATPKQTLLTKNLTDPSL
jgi:hypothetical protein